MDLHQSTKHVKKILLLNIIGRAIKHNVNSEVVGVFVIFYVVYNI